MGVWGFGKHFVEKLELRDEPCMVEVCQLNVAG